MARQVIPEVLLPRSGSDPKDWNRLLTGVSRTAQDANGYHGSFANPGSCRNGCKVGDLVLERVHKGNKRFHILWQLQRDGTWSIVAEDDSAGWAVVLRDAAIRAIEDAREAARGDDGD